jgi:ferredoxin
MARITALPDQQDFDASDGETLLEAALRARIPVAHACGGRAKCSTCRVWILDGMDACPERTERERLMADRLGSRLRSGSHVNSAHTGHCGCVAWYWMRRT